MIARFTLNYLKTNLLSREWSALITNASLIRSRSDYEDFFVCSASDTERLMDGAKHFLSDVEGYLEKRYLEV